jgi:hypothetical protein
MGIDGTYGFVYCGAEDIGIGAFTVTGSSVTGRDFAGGTYVVNGHRKYRWHN